MALIKRPWVDVFYLGVVVPGHVAVAGGIGWMAGALIGMVSGVDHKDLAPVPLLAAGVGLGFGAFVSVPRLWREYRAHLRLLKEQS